MDSQYIQMPVIKHEPWIALRACSGLPVEIFYPARGEDVKLAKSICRACPVREECLDYAIRVNEKNGIWGGRSERERRRIRRNLKIASTV